MSAEQSAPAPARTRPSWFEATVTETRPETARSARITLDVPGWPGSAPGAHVDVRLTAEDGYQATRAYSVAASAPGGTITLLVDDLPDGEVSSYLVRDLRPGDRFEVRGPLGAFFIWQPSNTARPVQLIAGGSGIVPLYAMATAHAAADDPSPFRLLYSVRSPREVYFASELAALEGPLLRTNLVYTRQAPADGTQPAGRLTKDALEEAVFAPDVRPLNYVCGSTPFVETVAGWLAILGHRPTAILTERFGGL